MKSLQFLSLIVLLLMVSCGPVVPNGGYFEPETGERPMDVQKEAIDIQPLPKPEVAPPEAPVEIEPERTEMVANTDGYDEWANDWRTKSYVVVLVSDGEKAARAVIPVGHSLYLATNPAVNVSVVLVGIDGAVRLDVDGEQVTMQAREDQQFKDGQIIVFVDDVIVR